MESSYIQGGAASVDAGDFKHHVADNGVDQFQSGQDAGIAVNHHAVYGISLPLTPMICLAFTVKSSKHSPIRSLLFSQEAHALHHEALQSPGTGFEIQTFRIIQVHRVSDTDIATSWR